MVISGNGAGGNGAEGTDNRTEGEVAKTEGAAAELQGTAEVDGGASVTIELVLADWAPSVALIA